MSLIKFKRGLKANLPVSANAGEPLITTDTLEAFIGTGSGLLNLCTTNNESSNKVTNGIKKFADGLILQWGQQGLSASTPLTINFPQAFPNGCLNVQTTPNNNAGTVGTPIEVYNLTATGFTANTNTTQACYWIAIGC